MENVINEANHQALNHTLGIVILNELDIREFNGLDVFVFLFAILLNSRRI
jgi:hypothetical protein